MKSDVWKSQFDLQVLLGLSIATAAIRHTGARTVPSRVGVRAAAGLRAQNRNGVTCPFGNGRAGD